MSSDSEEDRLPPVVAPSPHVHAHDVAALGKWMENVTDALESSLADAKKKSEKAASTIESSKAFSFVAVQLVEELYAKGKKFTVFHNELARQTAAHCPRVARMLVQVWSGMCGVLEDAIERYEQQVRLSQKFHSKFLRLVTHSEDKLSRLARENEELRNSIREVRAEITGKSSAIAALNREIDVWKTEVNKLNKRFADEMSARLHGDKFGSHRSTDFLSNQQDDLLDAMEAERVKQLAFVEQQNRLVRIAAATMMANHGATLSVPRSHTGTQTEDAVDNSSKPPAPPIKAQKAGIHIPKQFRKLLTSIPRKTRLFSIRFLRRLVLQVLLEKAVSDHTLTDGQTTYKQPMAIFVCEYMMKKYGLPSLADEHISSLIQSIRAFYDSDPRSRIFDLLIGAVSAREDDRPVLGIRCQEMVSEVVWILIEKKQINAQFVLTGDPDSFVMINRQKAIEALKMAFSFVAPALVDLMLVRVRTLPAARAKSSHMMISLEDFLCVVIESWVAEQFRWQRRMEAMFDKSSTPGPAVKDSVDTDVDLVESPSKAVRKRFVSEVKLAGESPLLSQGIASTDVPIISDALAQNEAEMEVDGNAVSTSTFGHRVDGGVVARPSHDGVRNNRHITLPSLRSALASAMPTLDMPKIDFMFDTARKALEAAAWHRKRKPWEFATDPATGRKFYYNTRTLESRWYMPILDRETVLSLDYCAFCEMCYENELLLSTAGEADMLDAETKASILIQKVVRGYVSRRRQSVDSNDRPRDAPPALNRLVKSSTEIIAGQGQPPKGGHGGAGGAGTSTSRLQPAASASSKPKLTTTTSSSRRAFG